MITAWVVVAAAAAAAYTDIAKRKIPNVLSGSLLVCGLLLQGIEGHAALLRSVIVCVVFLALGAAVFALGIIGGGDVKFIAAAGAALGWPHALPFALYTLVAGSLLGLTVALFRGQLRAVVRSVGSATFLLAGGLRGGITATTTARMPYAIAILAGAVAFALGNLFSLNPRFLT